MANRAQALEYSNNGGRRGCYLPGDKTTHMNHRPTLAKVHTPFQPTLHSPHAQSRYKKDLSPCLPARLSLLSVSLLASASAAAEALCLGASGSSYGRLIDVVGVAVQVGVVLGRVSCTCISGGIAAVAGMAAVAVGAIRSGITLHVPGHSSSMYVSGVACLCHGCHGHSGAGTHLARLRPMTRHGRRPIRRTGSTTTAAHSSSSSSVWPSREAVGRHGHGQSGGQVWVSSHSRVVGRGVV
mmetsp:Transcript_21069/g.51377  ORF Transcript_21069/g.51377 Transcript_21069/m.51377 type:complete len:240 (+) Transcript_21069:285-1004(+)